MSNKYSELREKQQKDIDSFPFMWAFNRKQFDEGMAKLGLSPTDRDKILSIGAGGYIRKNDRDALFEMFDRHRKELEEAIAGDPTGDGFIFDMFNYELANHEYGYTGNPESTLDSLGMTMEEIKADERLLHGWKLAVKRQRG